MKLDSIYLLLILHVLPAHLIVRYATLQQIVYNVKYHIFYLMDSANIAPYSIVLSAVKQSNVVFVLLELIYQLKQAHVKLVWMDVKNVSAKMYA